MENNQDSSEMPEVLSQEMFLQCELAIGYHFKEPALLQQALIHASLREKNGICNERLEFLGDAVLGLVISEFVYRNFQNFDEGQLSLVKSEVVSRATLARIAQNLNLHHCFICSKGIQKNKTNIPPSILANIIEAIIGAMYLDNGIEVVYQFVLKHFQDEVKTVINNPYQKNYKSLLQFLAQKYFGNTPTYKIVDIEGPNHIRTFTACAMIGKKKFVPGKGKSKKQAEQIAAYHAIQTLAEENAEIGEYVYNVLHIEKKMGGQFLRNMGFGRYLAFY